MDSTRVSEALNVGSIPTGATKKCRHIKLVLLLMIIYNVTINIDADVHLDWLQWMQKEHIPQVMATGMFTEYRFARVMSDEPAEGFTYSVQYLAESIGDYEIYRATYAPGLQAETEKRYKGKFVAFRTLLKMID